MTYHSESDGVITALQCPNQYCQSEGIRGALIHGPRAETPETCLKTQDWIKKGRMDSDNTYSHQKCAADFRRTNSRRMTAIVTKPSSTPVVAYKAG